MSQVRSAIPDPFEPGHGAEPGGEPEATLTHPAAPDRWTATRLVRLSPPLVLPFLVVTVADRLSKAWIGAHLWSPPRNVVIVPDWLELTPVANRGIAFGLLQETGGMLAIVTVGVMGGVAVWKWAEVLGARGLVKIALGMIAGGAIGNMIDRARLGYVIDFIHVPNIWIFQVFNVADASIVVGTIVLTLALGVSGKRKTEPRDSNVDPHISGRPSL